MSKPTCIVWGFGIPPLKSEKEEYIVNAEQTSKLMKRLEAYWYPGKDDVMLHEAGYEVREFGPAAVLGIAIVYFWNEAVNLELSEFQDRVEEAKQKLQKMDLDSQFELGSPSLWAIGSQT